MPVTQRATGTLLMALCSELRALLAFGLPLVPAAVSHWALLLVDRVILRRLEDLDAVGQYAIASRVSGVLVIGMTGSCSRSGPYLLSVFSDRPDQESFVRGRTLTYLTFVLGLGALALTLFAEELVAVAGARLRRRARGGRPARVRGDRLRRRRGADHRHRARAADALRRGCWRRSPPPRTSLLNLALIPPFGIVGAASPPPAGYAVLAVLYYWAAQRVYPTPFEPVKVLTILALPIAASFAAALPLDGVAAASRQARRARGFRRRGRRHRRDRARRATRARRFARGMVPSVRGARTG